MKVYIVGLTFDGHITVYNLLNAVVSTYRVGGFLGPEHFLCYGMFNHKPTNGM